MVFVRMLPLLEYFSAIIQMRLIKKILVFSLLFSFATSLFSQKDENLENAMQVIDKANKKDFLTLFYYTLSDFDASWWFRVPKDAFEIKEVKEVYTMENFSIFPIFLNVSEKAGDEYKIHFTCSIISPDKTEEKIDALDNTFSGKAPPPTAALEFPTGILAYFEAQDAYGSYSYKIDVENLLTGKKASFSRKINHIEWKSPTPAKTEEEFAKAFHEYSQTFEPQLLYSIFTSDLLNFRQQGSFHGLNPLFYSFMKHAFLRHAFLFEKLRGDFKNLSPKAQENTFLLLAFTKQKPIDEKTLNETQKILQEAIFENYKIEDNPYTCDKISNPAYNDLLWGEFFATGNYPPIRRILDVLGYLDEAAYARKVLGGTINPSLVDEEKFKQGMANITAAWSLVSNSENKLVSSYVNWAMEYDMQKNLLDKIIKSIEEYTKEKKMEAEANKPKPIETINMP